MDSYLTNAQARRVNAIYREVVHQLKRDHYSVKASRRLVRLMTNAVSYLRSEGATVADAKLTVLGLAFYEEGIPSSRWRRPLVSNLELYPIELRPLLIALKTGGAKLELMSQVYRSEIIDLRAAALNNNPQTSIPQAQ